MLCLSEYEVRQPASDTNSLFLIFPFTSHSLFPPVIGLRAPRSTYNLSSCDLGEVISGTLIPWLKASCCITLDKLPVQQMIFDLNTHIHTHWQTSGHWGDSWSSQHQSASSVLVLPLSTHTQYTGAARSRYIQDCDCLTLTCPRVHDPGTALMHARTQKRMHGRSRTQAFTPPRRH